MTAPDNGPSLGVGFSVQPGPDGPFIGMHWEFPFNTVAMAIPLEWADELVNSFSHELAKVIEQAKQQKTGLVVAPATTLDTLKGKN